MHDKGVPLLSMIDYLSNGKSPNGGSDWDSVHQTDLRNRPVVFAGRTGVHPLGMDSDGAPKSKKNTGKTP